MVVESVTIFIIFLVMTFLFLRSGKKTYAIATTPMLVVPFFEIIASALGEAIKQTVTAEMKSLIVVIGLAAGVALIGCFSSFIKGKRHKLAYVLLSGGFTTTLAIIFLYNNYVNLIIH